MNNPYNRPADSSVGLFICLQQIAYSTSQQICLQKIPTEIAYRISLQLRAYMCVLLYAYMCAREGLPVLPRSPSSRALTVCAFSAFRPARRGIPRDAFRRPSFRASSRRGSKSEIAIFCSSCASRVWRGVVALSRCALASSARVLWCWWYLYRGKPLKMLIARYFAPIVKNLTTVEQKKPALGVSLRRVWFSLSLLWQGFRASCIALQFAFCLF